MGYVLHMELETAVKELAPQLLRYSLGKTGAEPEELFSTLAS